MSDIKKIWEPLPGSQTLALSCPAHIIVYHGTRGPGKTDAQLMRFRRRVGLGYGRYWRGIIFDREYKNLDDLIAKSMRWFPEFKDGCKFLAGKSDYRWVWPTGEELLFRAIKTENDYWGYHGQEFPFIGWNELTKYPNDTLFDMLMSCNRSSFLPEEHLVYDEDGKLVYTPPELPLEVFATTNPYGAGHNWVKKRFIAPAPMGKIQTKEIVVFNPRTQKKEAVIKTQVHLFGSYRENRYLSPDYIAELESMTDPNKRRAWLFGDWDVVAGGMFDDVWDSTQNVVAPFPIPNTWKINRSFDYGASKPFSVGWWAESDGCDVRLANGEWIGTIKGDLYRIGEWYGCTGKANQGLHMLASDIARGIVEREIAMGIYSKVVPGPADNSIFDSDNGNSIAADMKKAVVIGGKAYRGVEWMRSDKSKGSRKDGWQKCRKWLKSAHKQYTVMSNGDKMPVPRSAPGLFCFNTCRQFMELFPVLPRDEVDMDDVDTDSEDHIGDEVRYRVLSSGLGAKGGKTAGTA